MQYIIVIGQTLLFWNGKRAPPPRPRPKGDVRPGNESKNPICRYNYLSCRADAGRAKPISFVHSISGRAVGVQLPGLGVRVTL